MPETFYLIDGHSQIFRAYWAPLGDSRLSAPSGEPTKATFIFSRILLNLIEGRRPDYCAMALDSEEGSAARVATYAAYKANRERMPEDLSPQIARIEQIVRAAGIPILRIPGEEADDVMASCVESLKDRDVDIYLVSRDKDLYQLLGPRVRLFDPLSDEVIDSDALLATKGFRPEQALEIQTLAGDKIDNIPGVPNVGMKRAAALIQKYGTAENVIAHAGELTPKLGEAVIAFAPLLPVTRSLVRLRRDCPIDFDIERARTSRFSLDRLAPIFNELGLKRLRVPGAGAEAGRPAAATAPPAEPGELAAGGRPAAGTAPPSDQAPPIAEHARVHAALSLRHERIARAEDLPRVADAIRRAGLVALDTEATSLRPRDARLVGISLAWSEATGVFVPVFCANGPTVPLAAVARHLGPALADPSIKKVGQNLKYDLQILRGAGLELGGIVSDSMVASYLLNSERTSHGLDFLAREFLGYECIPIADLIGRPPHQTTIDQADPDLLARYASEDASIAWLLHKAMDPLLASRGLRTLFDEVEMPLVGILADMEWHGVKIDTDLLAAISAEFGRKLGALREDIERSAGRPFNVDSPRQLAQILFDDLKLPVVKRTKTARSTDAEVLETLAATAGHPLPRLVLDYRELSKLKSTYVDVLPTLVSPASGRIHPSYHQAVAATGRLSASDPNIQNIPIRTEEGRRIRQAFVAEGPDRVLLTADYSQIELRILAHYSGDPALRAAFERGEDIHRWVAGEIWGIPAAEVPRRLRDQAKAVNFGIIYGQTAFGLSRSLGIPRGEAARFIAAYKEKFRGIAAFVQTTIENAREAGAVRTILGRQRPIAVIGSRNRASREQAERLAVNTVIQGSAADLIKVAMVSLPGVVARHGLRGRMIIQVHDELVFEVERSNVEAFADAVERAMSSAIALSVPLKVDMAWGRSWLEGKG